MLLSVDSCRESTSILISESTVLTPSSMEGFLEVYGYYDNDLESWNIDVSTDHQIIITAC
jgi:hypothetical protein